MLATLFGKFPFLEKLFADSAYQGPIFADGLAEILPYLKTEIIKRSDRASGFVQLTPATAFEGRTARGNLGWWWLRVRGRHGP